MLEVVKRKIKLRAALVTLFTVVFSLFINTIALAQTTPDLLIYEGRLLSILGVPKNTAHTFRFSFWKSSDFVASDLLAGGAINTSAPNYAGWQETHTITPSDNGTFSIKLGSNTPLPTIDYSLHKYIQVEVKPDGSPDASYQILDPTGDDTVDTEDRKTIASLPYAKNSEYLQNKTIGLAAGDLALLSTDGKWLISQIPGGTDEDQFVIDNNNSISGTGSIKLIFGNTLNKILEYDIDNSYFNFNDNVNIQGDLTVTGDINGVDINNISFSNISVRNKSMQFSPAYPGAVIEQVTGSNNRGKMTLISEPATPNLNSYKWTSRQTTLQDIDIVLHVFLPEDFDSWQSTPIEFRYKTENTDLAKNKIDVIIEDSTGAAVPGVTGASNLVSSTYAVSPITFASGTFTAGTEIVVRIRTSSSSAGASYVSDISFNYVGK